jgi:hypothetical protein
MVKKVGIRMLKKVLNSQGLYLSEDGFYSNGDWAIRDFLFKQRINKNVNLKIDRIVSKVIDLLDVKELATIEPWILNKNILQKEIREVYFYDNFKLFESIEYRVFYELDIDKEINDRFLINKIYYDFINQILPLSKVVARVVKKTSYLVYDNKEDFYDQDYSLVFLWFPKYTTYNLKEILAVCMPALKK